MYTHAYMLDLSGSPAPVTCNPPTLGGFREAECELAHERLGIVVGNQLHRAKHLIVPAEQLGGGPWTGPWPDDHRDQ